MWDIEWKQDENIPNTKEGGWKDVFYHRQGTADQFKGVLHPNQKLA